MYFSQILPHVESNGSEERQEGLNNLKTLLEDPEKFVARNLRHGEERLLDDAELVIALLADRGQYYNALSYTGFLTHPDVSRNPAIREMVVELETAANQHFNDRFEPDDRYYRNMETGEKINFVLSYPRSGNTFLMSVMQELFPHSRHSVFWGDGKYMSAASPVSRFPGPVFVKDHVINQRYNRNPCIIVIRHFEHVIYSAADYIAREEGSLAHVESFEKLNRYFFDDYTFGHWCTFMQNIIAFRNDGANVHILEYDSIMGDNGSQKIKNALNFSGQNISLDQIDHAIQRSKKQESSLRETEQSWSRENIYPAGHFMHDWLEARNSKSAFKAPEAHRGIFDRLEARNLYDRVAQPR